MIRVNDDYVIDVDSYNYTAMRDMHSTSKDKDGKERNNFKIIGYHKTLYGAILAVKDDMTRKLLSDGEKGLCDAIRVVREVSEEVEQLVREALEVKSDD